MAQNLFGWDLLYNSVKNDVKKKQDVLVCLTHLVMISNGFKCIGLGDSKNIDGTEAKSEILPPGWNNGYAIRYVFQVKRACGPAKLLEVTEDPRVLATSTVPSNSLGNGSKRVASNLRVFPASPVNQLQQFLVSIAKSKGFYGSLADNLCKDESYAEPKDIHCWNGERIGEYTKTVVDSGISMQKYNPEVKPSIDLQHLDPRIANLADKLRHVHQMIIAALGAAGLPESDNFMQSDSADGSGSGGGPDIMDDTDDADGRSGSGSGHGPIVTPNSPSNSGGGQTRVVNYSGTGTGRKHDPQHATPQEPVEVPTNDIKENSASIPYCDFTFISCAILLIASITRY